MTNSEERDVGRAAGIVGFYTILSRILGLVRDMVLAAFFGAGLSADAFVVALRIPNLLRRLFAEGSLTIAFIPVFTEYLTTKNRKEAFDLARTVLTLLTVSLVIVTLAGVLASPWIVRVQAFGFGGSGSRYELTVLLTRITFPYIFFISLTAFFMGVLNSLKHFGAPAAAPIFLNVGIIGAAYAISPNLSEPIVGMAIGVLIGGILQVALQLPWVFKEGLRLFPRWQPGHPAARKIGRLMLPAILGSAVYQLNSFIGTFLASFLPVGSVSWLYFADRLVQFPLGVFAIAMSTAALPSLSAYAAQKKFERFRETMGQAFRLVFFVIMPSTVGLIVLGKPIVGLLLERGAFEAYHTMMTNRALFYYAIGLWAFSGIRVMVAAYYALQDTKTPVQVAIAAILMNLILSMLLMRPMGHAGIALSLSLASSFQCLLLMILFKRKIQVGYMHHIILPAAKSMVAAGIMGLVIHQCLSKWLLWDPSKGVATMIMRLLILILIGITAYFAAAKLLRCRELTMLSDMVRPARSVK